MVFLLDVNVLIALVDPVHVRHDQAHGWFAKTATSGWATCPITEIGVLRIVGNARYPNTPGPPAAALTLMLELRSLSGHVFWPDDISLLDSHLVRASSLLDSAQVTDSYLLALAHAHKGKLATFDRRLVTHAVVHGSKALHVIQ